MTITLAHLRIATRVLVDEATVNVFSDEALDVILEHAIRRLGKDHPHEKTGVITGDGGKYYKLTSEFTDWVEDWSSIISFVQSAPNISNEEEIDDRAPSEARVYHDGTDEYVRFATGVSTSNTVAMIYTTTWKITGLDGASTTTLPQRLENAIEYLGAALLCYRFSARSAGVKDSSLPGDMLSYRTKQREYSDAGKTFERQYRDELGMGVNIAAAAARRDYNPTAQGGITRMTHVAGR